MGKHPVNEKEAGETILITDKINFRAKRIIRKGCHLVMKVSHHEIIQRRGGTPAFFFSNILNQRAEKYHFN